LINQRIAGNSIIVGGDNLGDIYTSNRVEALETEIKYLKEMMRCKDEQLEEKERLINVLMDYKKFKL